MIRPLFLCAALCLSGGAFAQPSQDEIATARMQYIDGDYEAALKVLLPAAEAGDANAQNIVADAYDEGNGVEQDTDLALDWWKKSAAQDFSRALHNLGQFHRRDDPETARGYYERAVEQGNAGSMTSLGFMYESGAFTGEPQWDMALPLYERATDLGDAQAMVNLGNMYVSGQEVGEDLAYAFELFHAAAMQGNAAGIGNLGVMYDFAYAVPRDPLAAVTLYAEAAARGHANSARNLAYVLIEDDIGSWHDPATGWAWCQVALELASEAERPGFTESCDYLSGLIDDAARAAADGIRPTLLR